MEKNNNKGYTLVELMLTLLIFSVIMVSIIMIMRTAIVSYSNGLTEASVQENAQIAVNQISNILVDTRGFTDDGSGNAAANPWHFSHPTYGTIELKQDAKYKTNSDGTIYIDDEGKTVRIGGNLLMNSEIIAENVVDFNIKGLYKTDDPATNPVDNAAIITLTVDDGQGGHEYTVDKVVYFRNNVENVDNYMYDVINADGGSTDPVVVGGAKQEVNRYAEVDLTKMYGMVSADELDGVTGTNYEFVNGVRTASATPDNNPGIRITTKGVLNTEYTTKEVPVKDLTDPQCNKVVGYDKDGNKIEVILYTKKVKIDDSIGLIEVRATQTVNNGMHTTVPVEGIDIYNGIKKGKIKVHVVQTFKAGTDSVSINYDMEASDDPSVGNKGKQMTFSDAMKAKGYGDRFEIAMVGDVNSHGITITTNNTPFNTAASVAGLGGVKKELDFDITIKEINPGGSEVERYNKEHKFNFAYTGEDLTKYNN